MRPGWPYSCAYALPLTHCDPEMLGWALNEKEPTTSRLFHSLLVRAFSWWPVFVCGCIWWGWLTKVNGPGGVKILASLAPSRSFVPFVLCCQLQWNSRESHVCLCLTSWTPITLGEVNYSCLFFFTKATSTARWCDLGSLQCRTLSIWGSFNFNPINNFLLFCRLKNHHLNASWKCNMFIVRMQMFVFYWFISSANASTDLNHNVDNKHCCS